MEYLATFLLAFGFLFILWGAISSNSDATKSEALTVIGLMIGVAGITIYLLERSS